MMVLPPFLLGDARRLFHPRGKKSPGGLLGGIIHLLPGRLLQSSAAKVQ